MGRGRAPRSDFGTAAQWDHRAGRPTRWVRLRVALMRASLEGLIAKRYPSPEWAVFYEVANATGWAGRRRADAVALGVWPSRGHALLGFEVKRDRRDWLREKENPAKADVIASLCDQWWVVTSKDTIAPVDELPEAWGLLVANTDHTALVMKKPAVPYPDRDTTVIPRAFVAAMLRKVAETTVPKETLATHIQHGIDAYKERMSRQTLHGRLETEIATLRTRIEKFEDASGLRLDDWRGPDKVGEAVKALLALQDSIEFGAVAARLDKLAKEVRAVEAQLKERVGVGTASEGA